MYKMIIFDLDGTLAESKSPINKEMAEALGELLSKKKACIITGGNYEQIAKQVVKRLPKSTNFSNLHLMPTCGSRYLRFSDNNWHVIYENDLLPEVKNLVIKKLEEGAKALEYWVENSYGPLIEDRGSQITYSALGQNAPKEEKEKWDPDGSKKRSLRDKLAVDLPGLEVRSGGSTSIDITLKGMDKAYGIEQLRQYCKITIMEMYFIGDRLDEGGNDFPVISTGVTTKQVKDHQETLEEIRRILA